MKGKKTVACVTIMTLLLSLLTGCGRNTGTEQNADTLPDAPAVDYANDPDWFGTDDGKTVTLNFWGGIQPEYGYQQLVDNFNREYANRGVQVEYTRYSNNDDGNTRLETYLLVNADVDVFIGYGSRDRLFNRGEAGMLYDYSDYLKSAGFDVARELGRDTARMVRYGGCLPSLTTRAGS